MTHLQESVEPSAEPDACQTEPSKPLKPINLTTPVHYHPLDPLSAAEINSACRAAIDHLSQTLNLGQVVITYVSLIEPKKEEVLRYLGILRETSSTEEGCNRNEPTRECEVCGIEVETGSSYLIEVRLEQSAATVSKPPTKLPDGAHSTISIEEVDEAERIAKNDASVISLCQQVGISKEQIFGDGWAMGFDSRFGNFKRLQQCLMYARLVEHGNLYAHPLDFVVIVDILRKKVIHVDFPGHRIPGPEISSGTTLPSPLPATTSDKDGIDEQDLRVALHHSGRDRIPPPRRKFDYLPHLLNRSSLELDNQPWQMRRDLKPLHIVQPEGVSFVMEGNVLKWQKWQMHVGFNYREGLVINTVTYTDRGQVRPLFYRLSLAEMVVPYAAPEAPHHRKFAFDVGEYGLGNLANSLSLGCDCLGTIHYLDAVNVSLEGKAVVINNAVCIHEEDAGVLWKHSDLRPGGLAHSVRSRKLVVSMICTVANYEYLLYWNFFQDGTISFDVKLSGILNVYLLAEGEDPDGFGTRIAPGIVAQHHAHTFCLRIDPMIDGLQNSVVQTDLVGLSEPTGSSENYLGNGFKVHRKVLKRTSEGAQKYDHSKGRYWSIVNPNKLHYASKEPIGYRIVCRDQPPMLAKPDSMIAKRAPFAKHDFFVTPYVPHQYYPSGKFVPGTMETPTDSIENWLAEDKSIENEDIVAYVTFGINHIPTPEQFPVMSAETLTVTLKPSGFFDQNASLDVPNAKDTQSRLTSMPPETLANHDQYGQCCQELTDLNVGKQKSEGEAFEDRENPHEFDHIEYSNDSNLVLH
ncbi:hypothetical protein PGT21_015460 [Puccinia graminis f. sp. tritici]|uniref:Amine oxidase n=1 Tax=Puccinia graminis f. sp. tritici TaxID=56615 RepID=A0A5B0NWB0_PUCGR|nr:hypothetical protein PGT21_015460 [Puccinia graminis f. sp. tritici]KAA1093531.1 hypothetical protein PGTUg99_025697 [Puccinia graminis f. sp. tritici]